MSTGNGRRCLFRKDRRAERGITVAELLVAVVVLGMIAVVATPHLASTNTQTLDLAAQSVVEAVRFARGEAIRTGKPHGINASTTNQQLKVYWWDDTGGTPTAVYNVYHPLNKHLYTVDFNDDSPFARATVDSAYFKFASGATSASDLVFAGGSGAPRLHTTVSMLDIGTVTMSLGGDTRTITIEPMTGRVTVQ